jgi:hypothetical protein
MTMAYGFAILTVTAIITATLLPFFPGGYDPLARPLSGMAWMFGRAGLLLVPLGGLWLLFPKRSGVGIGPRDWLVWLTLGTGILVALVLVLVAFAFGPLLAVGTGTISGGLIVQLRRRLRATAPLGRTLPGLLAVAPITVFAVQLTFLEPIALWARNRVIANSAPLIAEIEGYRARHGAYPVSIFALYGDVKPAVMGVQRYYYEPSGDAYNLIFEEPSPVFGLRRFVVYNPRDKQRLTVHETDRLRLDDAGLEADNAGYTIVEPLPQPHWKLFTFRS